MLTQNCVKILLLLFLIAGANGLVEESYVRVQSESDGSRIVTLLDFERIVNFIFDQENRIVDCQVNKRNEMLRKMVLLEVGTALHTWMILNIVFSPKAKNYLNRLQETDMSGGLNVQYLSQEIDVAWYGRKCSQYIRDKVSKKDKLNRNVCK